MVYIPFESVRMVDLADVVARPAPALLIIDRDDSRMLVADGYGIFLEGQYRFHAIGDPGRGDWQGAIVEDVTIEVDLETVSFESTRAGAVFHSGDGLFLHALVQQRGSFLHRLPIRIGSVAAAPAGGTLHFPRWRLIAVVRDEAVVLFESDASVATA